MNKRMLTASIMKRSFQSLNIFPSSENIAKAVKARDQYGTVLNLPKGMKPHMKNVVPDGEASQTTTTSKLSLFYDASLTI